MSDIKITVQGRSAVGKTTVIEVIMHALRQRGLNKIHIHGVDESLVNDKVGVPDFERLKTVHKNLRKTMQVLIFID